MREHDALRQPGRAARVRQDDQVRARIDRGGGRIAVSLQQRRERRGSLGFAEDEDLLDSGFPRRLLRLGHARRHREEKLRAGIFQLRSQLSRRIERAHRGVHAADERDGMEHDRVLGQVRAVDGDDIPFPQAARGEAGGCSSHAVGPLAVGERSTAGAVDERRLVRTLDRAFEEERGERHLWQDKRRLRRAKNHRRTSTMVGAGFYRRSSPELTVCGPSHEADLSGRPEGPAVSAAPTCHRGKCRASV